MSYRGKEDEQVALATNLPSFFVQFVILASKMYVANGFFYEISCVTMKIFPYAAVMSKAY